MLWDAEPGTGCDYRELDRLTLEKAKQWCAEKYGITEWEKNRMGDYVPKPLNTMFPLPKREKVKQ